MVTLEQVQQRVKQDRIALPARGLPAGMEEILLNAYARLSDQFHGYIRALEKIVTDATLSPTGQAQQRARFATQWAQDLQWLETLVTDANAAVARLSAIAYTWPALTVKRDATIQFFREQEIRGLYANQSEGERIGAFTRAMIRQDGDTEASANRKAELVRAFLDAPGSPLISEDIQTRVLHEYAEATNPTVVQMLEQTQKLLEQLQSLSKHVFLWLTGLEGLSAESVAVFGMRDGKKIVAA